MYGGVGDAFAALLGEGSGVGDSVLEVVSEADSPDKDSEEGESEDGGCDDSSLDSADSVARGRSKGPSQPS